MAREKTISPPWEETKEDTASRKAVNESLPITNKAPTAEQPEAAAEQPKTDTPKLVFKTLGEMIRSGVDRGKRQIYRIVLNPNGQPAERFVIASSNAAGVVAAVEDVYGVSISIVNQREIYDAMAAMVRGGGLAN